MTVITDPLLEYSERLKARRAAVEAHEAKHRLVGNLRLAAALLVPVFLWLAFWWAFLPLAAFVALVIIHLRISEQKRQALKAVAFYEMGIARIEDQWIGKGQSTELMRDESHLYAADLDIFGKGSLFELLCTARTRAGEEILANWLASPAPAAVVRSRQEAVEAFRSRLDLREALAVVGADVRKAIHPATMTSWGAAAAASGVKGLRIAGSVLSVLVLAALGIWFVTREGMWLWVYYSGLGVQVAYTLLLRGRTNEILEVAEWPNKYLDMLSRMLALLEVEKFPPGRLAELQRSLQADASPPSRQIQRLGRLIDALSWNGLDFFIVVVFLMQWGVVVPLFYALLWKPQVALGVEMWRQKFGASIERWISVAGEFEAFASLSGYAYEHPSDPFPEVVDQPDAPFFEGEALRHPLMAQGKCVPNSVRLDSELRLLVVSGSNMSGKSTFLRTIGVNAVLALAGAPVRAGRVRLSVLAIGSTIRVQDSLQAGTSRFYAEIQRIRHIVDLTAAGLPVLFLLDEVLHGTNSHDRAIGAAAIVKGLIHRGAIGLATTHDLALASVAEDLSPLAKNVHFDDTLQDGGMIFDYRMRPGVVQRSNALELMRAVGLEV